MNIAVDTCIYAHIVCSRKLCRFFAYLHGIFAMPSLTATAAEGLVCYNVIIAQLSGHLRRTSMLTRSLLFTALFLFFRSKSGKLVLKISWLFCEVLYISSHSSFGRVVVYYF